MLCHIVQPFLCLFTVGRMFKFFARGEEGEFLRRAFFRRFFPWFFFRGMSPPLAD